MALRIKQAWGKFRTNKTVVENSKKVGSFVRASVINTVNREIKRAKKNQGKRLSFGFRDVDHMTDF